MRSGTESPGPTPSETLTKLATSIAMLSLSGALQLYQEGLSSLFELNRFSFLGGG